MKTVYDLVMETHCDNPDNNPGWWGTKELGLHHLDGYLKLPADSLETLQALWPLVTQPYAGDPWECAKTPAITVARQILVETKDPEIIGWVIQQRSDLYTSALRHPCVPQELVLYEVTSKIPKDEDPCRDLNGREFRLFLLHDSNSWDPEPHYRCSPEVVNAIAYHARLSKVQRRAILHPSVSKEALAHVARKGKTQSIKDKAQELLNARILAERPDQTSICWDHREMPDLEDLREALEPLGLHVYEDPRTEGSDMFGYVFSQRPLEAHELPQDLE